MPIKVEAAVVTQKRETATFNSDSVNINGKIIPRDVIHNGYKGVGVIEGDSHFVLSGSPVEGFADASVVAFNERAVQFKQPDSKPVDVITEYFKESVSALCDMGRASSDITLSVLYVSDNAIIAAKSGNSQIYTYSPNGFVKITPALYDAEDGASQYGLCSFPCVSEGDTFLLVGAGTTQVLSDKDIEDICKVSEGSVKKIVNLAAKVALSKEAAGSVSVMAIKVIQADERAGSTSSGGAAIGFTPEFVESDRSDISDTPADDSDNKSDIDLLHNDEDVQGGGKKFIKMLLACAIVVALLVCAFFGLKIFGIDIESFIKKELETSVTTTVSETTTKIKETTTKAAATTTVPETTTEKVTEDNNDYYEPAPVRPASTTEYRPSTTRAPVASTEEPGTVSQPTTEPSTAEEPSSDRTTQAEEPSSENVPSESEQISSNSGEDNPPQEDPSDLEVDF